VCAQAAALLGYPSHAAFVLEKRMAKRPEMVSSFLTDLSDRLTPKVRKERERERECVCVCVLV
jgi:Zn-dependent oligopeptidase